MTLEFWYDFAAAYAYPAAWRIERLAAAKGVRVVWRPFLLEADPLEGGRAPGARTEMRRRYLWRDLERICEREMLPFRRPSVHPRRTLLAARLAAAGADRPWLSGFSRGVYAANYGQDKDIADPAVLAGLVCGAGGDATLEFARAAAEEGKARLRQNTSEAEAKGLFGAPSFVCLGGGGFELFWGNDRLEHAVDWAAEH